jgi:type I restriction enzyme S subunit
VFGANGQIGFYSAYNHDRATILVTCRGATCGTVNVAPPFSYVTGNAMALDDLNEAEVDLRFLFRQLSFKGFRTSITGSAQPQITRESLAPMTIVLPLLAEQRRIAAILDQADHLRAKRRAAIAKLDALAQSVFLELFGHPTQAEDKDLKPISHFVQGFETGRSIVSADQNDNLSEYRVLKISAVTTGNYIPTESKALPRDYQPPVEHLVKRGDLLFSRANTANLIGATAYVVETPTNIALPDKLWRFTWKDPESIEPYYVWQLFQHPAVRLEISRRASGTSGSMKNISKEKLMAIRVRLPPIETQRKFADAVRALLRTKTASSDAALAADRLVENLQIRAFSGGL